jgi:hypothetical protein
MLSVVRPTLVSIINEVIEEVRARAVDEVQTQQELLISSDMARVVSNIVDGLSEVQVNNMQRNQLLQLDRISASELQNKEGCVQERECVRARSQPTR